MKLTHSNNKIILSNNLGSDLYILELDTEILIHKPIEHHSIPSRKSLKLSLVVESISQLHQRKRQLGEDINFTAPVWDELNQVYYRFAYFMKHKEVNGKQEPAGAKVFLIALDKDFNLLSEAPLEAVKKIPGRHFVKDGKIWMFVNVEDEMGFVRLSFN
jgi:hypothetical protein